jgi:hypothetical protein
MDKSIFTLVGPRRLGDCTAESGSMEVERTVTRQDAVPLKDVDV